MMHASFTSTERCIEELLFHMPTVANGATNDWAKGFAKSIVKQSKRRGWRPTPKQIAMMRRLVSDLFAYGDDDLSLIE
ncbi:hypothetical protein [Pararhodobacter oceanensis]|uniref:hypothetical protein n=1 Tax=Pararhodobacter oceanensis TaxID=2172121 RepID=UPI003A93425D